MSHLDGEPAPADYSMCRHVGCGENGCVYCKNEKLEAENKQLKGYIETLEEAIWDAACGDFDLLDSCVSQLNEEESDG